MTKINSFMKTAKVSKVESCKEYNGGNGLTYYHNLIMDNGDEINIGKKKQLVVGDELNYELTGGDDGQQRFKKAKTPKIEGGYSGGGGSKTYTDNSDAILYQVCLKATVDNNQKALTPLDEDQISVFALNLAMRSKDNIKFLKMYEPR